jgi:hypothetical protein
MKDHRLCLLLAVVIAAFTTSALADEPATTTNPTSESTDKWQYTLFNPTPTDQLRDMDTDRPNVANTPHTIDAGHFQIEEGLFDYTHYRYHASSANNFVANDFAFGETNIRVGIFNNFEVNAVVNAFQTDRTHDYAAGFTTRASGFGDTSLGFKLNLWGDDGASDVWSTALAIQPQFKFPTGRGVIGNGRFESSIAFPLLVNLPYDFHLGVQPGVSFERNTANTGSVTGFANAVSVDRVVFGKLDVYAEYSFDATTERHVKTVQTFDVGGTYPLTDNVVLDAGVNLGLNKATPNVEAVVGVSVRF